MSILAKTNRCRWPSLAPSNQRTHELRRRDELQSTGFIHEFGHGSQFCFELDRRGLRGPRTQYISIGGSAFVSVAYLGYSLTVFESIHTTKMYPKHDEYPQSDELIHTRSDGNHERTTTSVYAETLIGIVRQRFSRTPSERRSPI